MHEKLSSTDDSIRGEQNISPISIPIVNNRYVIQPSENSAESVNSILDRLERNGFQIVTIGDKVMAIPIQKQ